MEKVLKPYTIIPNSLYVEREADRQLKRIIEDMGRPGYVLVSRQMGKTNLLIHSKRQYQGGKDIFVYIDLSNPFDTAKECFENIIDTIIDTTDLLSEDHLNEINTVRLNKNQLPPHKVHLNELRVVLNSIEGKLVIILDEIDALTRSSYSDLIFSQIRSIYFSRINYQELNRLTYILSGVVEPTEIIKDPKISPFNIGQKIFLNDFSFEEFTLLVNKAKLEVSYEVLERIFYWTNGNPRMSWDLCSEVENLLINKNIEPKDVDDLVQIHYLTSYDKPPIDNIRELVKKDKNIRNSLIEINYNKSKNISDSNKSKLYLAGIVNYREDDIKIKNPIISEALNLAWINQVEVEEKGAIDYAIDLCVNERYDEALAAFENFLINNTFPSDKRSVAYFYMGKAYLANGRYDKALECLNLTNFNNTDSHQIYLYNTVRLTQGKAYFFIGKYEESLAVLKSIINTNKKDDVYITALINYASFLTANRQLDEPKKIYNDLINENFYKDISIKEEIIKDIQSLAFFNLGSIYIIEGQFELAVKSLRSSIEFSPDYYKPVKYITLYKLLDDEVEKQALLHNVVDLIITKQFVPSKYVIDKPHNYNLNTLNLILLYTYNISPNSLFIKIYNYINNGKHSLGNSLLNLITFALQNEEISIGLLILKNLYDNLEDSKFGLNDEEKLVIVKLHLNITKQVDVKASNIYISLFIKLEPKSLDIYDFYIFMSRLMNSLSNSNFTEFLNLVEVLYSYKKKVDKETYPNYLLVQNLELQYYTITNNELKRFEIARSILAFLERESFEELANKTLLTVSALEMIRKSALNAINIGQLMKAPIKFSKIYNRNEIVKVRYKNGIVKEVKYKKVIEDLNNGSCIIVDE
ncbi:putative WD repeat-containing protein slr0143 [Fibrisoma limi BUZ 3]|uniref:Putative WD repeat-containing protein slr0143 n=1 Tax=Fibrisoma limi BUZ 3 TaxID=1185876 RepID=I2GHI7_9BACT|nr:AAA-like domain-containing protein [Fibrisoma limi]CCH53362.1 putative WD repeat-containing protein slr0143 [Fibrisoma limi BUZ 3]